MSPRQEEPSDLPTIVQPPTGNDGAGDEALWEECRDDVTYPPGGSPQRMLTRAGVVDAPDMPLPDYLTRRGRDLRLDMLRGFFVVAMIIDHVRGQSPLYLITGGNRFYTSAAEGFFLTSGLVAGLVYKRMIEREDLGPALQKVIVRAVSLYLLTIGLTLVMLPLSEALFLPWAQGIDFSDPARVIVSILTLHRTYYLVDVMLLYTVLFLFAPLAFVMLARGHSGVVLGVSLLLWGVFQFYPEYAALPWPIAGNYLFDFSAWQLLFFGGLVLGYRQERIPALGCRETRIALVVSGLLFAALIVTWIVIERPLASQPTTITAGGLTISDIRTWLQDSLFSKVSLRPGRLFASAITFTFFFLVLTHFWAPFHRALGWLLLPLGQHALYAYTAHLLLASAIAAVLQPFDIPSPGPWWLNAAIQIAGVLLIWLLVKKQFLAPRPATMRRWYLAPAALAVVAFIVIYLNPTPTLAGADSTADATSEGRTPTRFGTPIPRTASGGLAAPKAVPTPTPMPAQISGLAYLQQSEQDAEKRLSRYTGNLDGTLIERNFYSSELDRDMPYNIYLPPDYFTADRRYPVLYMLHGGGGHRDEWLAYGLAEAADREIRNGNLPPMVIVFPQGDTGYWTDNVDDGERWGTYIWRDLVRHIDTTYRTLRSSDTRAIGGNSMGAWGALNQAFLHPTVFGTVGAHSPSLRNDETIPEILGTGEEFAKRDPVSIAGTATGLDSLNISIDAGQEDPWRARTDVLNNVLTNRDIPHTYQVHSGGHDYTYWMEHIVDYLRFYGNAMARQ